MTLAVRGTRSWLAMIVAGFSLGAIVFVAWPGGDARPQAQATPPAKVDPVRRTASVDAEPALQRVDAAGAAYSWELFAYELNPAPLLDAVIGAPEPVDAS